MRSPIVGTAALFVLSAVSFDLTRTWADSDLVPAWPDSERKPEWPEGPVKDFLRNLQRPDIPNASSWRGHAVTRATP